MTIERRSSASSSRDPECASTVSATVSVTPNRSNNHWKWSNAKRPNLSRWATTTSLIAPLNASSRTARNFGRLKLIPLPTSEYTLYSGYRECMNSICRCRSPAFSGFRDDTLQYNTPDFFASFSLFCSCFFSFNDSTYSRRYRR